MPGPTLISDADLSGLLKNLYTQYRQKVQNLVTPLYSQIQRAKAGGPRNFRWGGNGAYWDVVTGRPAGGNVSASGYLSQDTFAQEKQANTGVARAYVTRQIDGLAFVGTQSKEAAFATIAEKTMSEIRDASALLMQRELHGAGNGVLATVGTVTDSTHIIVSNPYGVTGAGQGSLLVSVGDYVAFRNSTGGTLRTGKAQVSTISVSGTNSTLTLSASCGVTVNDIVVTATTSDDSYAATSGVNQINGLINLTNRSNSYTLCHGLNATDYPIWDGVRLVAGTDTPDASTPTESDVWTLIKAVAGRSGKDAMLRPQEFLLMMTPGMAKGLMDSTVAQRRFSDPAQFQTKIRAGYKAINICGVDCFEDYYCPANTIYLLHLPSLAWVDAADWGFVEFEGAGPWRWISGRDAFETSYKYYGNFVALARNAHGSITSYTNDTVFYTHVI
jgi:hypothetical protein